MSGTENEPGEPHGYETEYSEKGFWDKVRHYAKKAGREVVERALQLYFAAQAPETPVWARSIIYGALGYFITTVDAVPDITPVVGFTDDLGVLAAAIATVAAHITPEIRKRSEDKTRKWFGDEEGDIEIIEGEARRDPDDTP